MIMKAHVIGQKSESKNKLQQWAAQKGLTTGYQFCNAMVNAEIMSHGTAVDKWNSGRAGNTAYATLLKVAQFLGAERIEDVFDP